MQRGLLVGLLLVIGLSFLGTALPIEMVWDSAPNIFGSSEWQDYLDEVIATMLAGTREPLANATYPGSNYITPWDEAVYSFDDLGKRMHNFVLLPGDPASLSQLVELKWIIDYFGTDWTYEGGGWAVDAPNLGWNAPTTILDVGSGFSLVHNGFAWWFGLSGKDLMDLEAANIWNAQTYLTFSVRIRDNPGAPWEVVSHTLKILPKEIHDFAVANGYALSEAFVVLDRMERTARAIEFGVGIGMSPSQVLALIDQHSIGRVTAAIMLSGGNIETVYAILGGYDFGDVVVDVELEGSGTKIDPYIVVKGDLFEADVELTFPGAPVFGVGNLGYLETMPPANVPGYETFEIPYNPGTGAYEVSLDTTDLELGRYIIYVGPGHGGGSEVIYFTVI